MVKRPVLERVGANGYEYVERPLEDLSSDQVYEGKYFKIVKGKNKQAVAIDDPELSLKAATVYFHLTKARKYWTEVLKSAYVENMERMTVRLEITNEYSPIAHFKNDNLEPKYNNAFTVPGGETPDWVPADRQDKWGMEIWFNPMKRISSAKLADSMGANPLEAQLGVLQGPLVNSTLDSFTRSALTHVFYPGQNSTSLLQSFTRHAGTLALLYGIVEASRHMDHFFMEDFYYLDTAMIPEVIYHEFAHAALSDQLEPTHATAVIEGMADYFATLVAGETMMYRRIVGFSNNVEKDALNQNLYHPYLERSFNATGDFVLSLLWKVKQKMEITGVVAREGAGFPDRLVYTAGQYLATDTATVNRDLPRALLKSCQKICSSKNRRMVMDILLKSFEEKGL